MKKSIKILVAVVLFVVSMIDVQAQDVITMKGGETMEVKITELNENIIKYYVINDADQLIFTLPRGLVKEVQFGFGKKHVEVAPTESNLHYFTGDKQEAVKLNFTSLGNNATILSYERSLKPAYSIETSVKFVGLGIGEGDFKGVAFDFGPKFKTKSILRKSGEYRPRHLLHGGYFKPVVGINFLKDDGYSKNFVNFGMDVGKQWIFSNVISLDAFIGYHYLAGDTSYTEKDSRYGYEYVNSEVNSGDLVGFDKSAVTFGLKIGFLLNGKK